MLTGKGSKGKEGWKTGLKSVCESERDVGHLWEVPADEI